MGKVLGSPRENRSDSRARSRVAPSATATTARALVAMVVLISGWMFGVLSDPGMAGAATAVTLNPNGGATSADGLKITTADGELQVVRSGTGQLYGPTMSPPSLVNNYFALAVGTSPTGGVVPASECRPTARRIDELASNSSDAGHHFDAELHEHRHHVDGDWLQDDHGCGL